MPYIFYILLYESTSQLSYSNCYKFYSLVIWLWARLRICKYLSVPKFYILFMMLLLRSSFCKRTSSSIFKIVDILLLASVRFLSFFKVLTFDIYVSYKCSRRSELSNLKVDRFLISLIGLFSMLKYSKLRKLSIFSII